MWFSVCALPISMSRIHCSRTKRLLTQKHEISLTRYSVENSIHYFFLTILEFSLGMKNILCFFFSFLIFFHDIRWTVCCLTRIGRQWMRDTAEFRYKLCSVALNNLHLNELNSMEKNLFLFCSVSRHINDAKMHFTFVNPHNCCSINLAKQFKPTSTLLQIHGHFDFFYVFELVNVWCVISPLTENVCNWLESE